MNAYSIEPERIASRHDGAALVVTLAALRKLVEAVSTFTAADCTDEAVPALRTAWREARELLQVAAGELLAGEVPPIPLQDVPPIPPPGSGEDEQGFGGNDWRNRPHRIAQD